jgi:IS4 transposase
MFFSDQIGRPALPKARAGFPAPLRRVRFFDREHRRYFIFLTNNLQIPAWLVARLHRLRWRIELFFRWIKQHLRINCYGTSPNAVRTQIWIALCVYLLIAILYKQLNLPGSIHKLCRF